MLRKRGCVCSTCKSLKAVAMLASIILAGCSDGGSSTDGEGSSDDGTVAFPLTVAQTVPLAVAPGANGEAVFIVDTETGDISGSTTVSGLTGNPTAAHIHAGVAGVAGDVVVTLEGSDESNVEDGIEETWTVPEGTVLSSTELASFSAGELYVNVHTDENETGELRGQLIDGAPAGTYTFTFTNTAEHQPLTAPVVVIRTDDGPIVDEGNTAFDDDDILIEFMFLDFEGILRPGFISIAEDGDNEPMVQNLEQLSEINLIDSFAVALTDRANPALLLPGASTSVTLTPDVTALDPQVFGIVSKVVCTNDGYTGVDFQPLPTGVDTFTAAVYDAGTEVNSTQLDTWVDDCGGSGNSHEAEELLPFLELQLHPGQSGTQIPPDASTSIYDFAMGDEFLEITITPN